MHPFGKWGYKIVLFVFRDMDNRTPLTISPLPDVQNRTVTAHRRTKSVFRDF